MGFEYCELLRSAHNFLGFIPRKKVTLWLTFVYAHNRAYDRSPLWNYILNVNTSLPWLLTGDFNCVVNLNEILGERETWNSEMQASKDCLLNAQLIHMRTVRNCFTWSNNRPNDTIHKRLDRDICNSTWLNTFSNAQTQVLAREIMDHSPLISTIPMDVSRL